MGAVSLGSEHTSGAPFRVPVNIIITRLKEGMQVGVGVGKEEGENIKPQQPDICMTISGSQQRAPVPSVPDAKALPLTVCKDKKDELAEKRTVRRQRWKQLRSKEPHATPH